MKTTLVITSTPNWHRETTSSQESDKCCICGLPIVERDAEYIEVYVATNAYHIDGSPVSGEKRSINIVVHDGVSYYTPPTAQRSIRRHFLKH